MLDLVLRNAVLPDGRSGMTIACEGGRIVSVSRDAVAEARRIIDAAGGLVSPPFVDAHFHMDSTLTYGRPRVNRSGTLLEGIELWGELKPSLTHDEIRARGRAVPLGRGARHPRDPQSRGRLRSIAAGGEGAARGPRARQGRDRSAARRVPAGRLPALPCRRDGAHGGARPRRRRRRWHSALRADDGGRGG